MLGRFIQSLPKPDWLKGKLGYSFLFPSLALIGLLIAGLGILLWYSLQTFHPIYLMESKITGANYIRIFTNQFYWILIWRTAYVSVTVTLLSIIFAYPYAYIVTRTESIFLRKLLLILSLVPFTIGTIIRAYAWLIVMGKNGLINAISFTVTGVRVKLMYTGPAVIIGLLQIMIPIAIIQMIPAFVTIKREMEMAAENCGANRWKTFLYILIPLSRAGLTSAALVTFTLTFTSYAVPKFLGGGKFNLIGNQIYQQIFRTMNWPFAGAISLVALLIASGFIYSIFHLLGRGEMRM